MNRKKIELVRTNLLLLGYKKNKNMPFYVIQKYEYYESADNRTSIKITHCSDRHYVVHGCRMNSNDYSKFFMSAKYKRVMEYLQ